MLVPTQHGRRIFGVPPHTGAAYDRMLQEMADDPDREKLVDLAAVAQIRAGRGPVVALSHRVAHARAISERWAAGRLLGGATHRREFQAVIDDLRAGRAQLAAGTIQAMGVGKDIRGLRTVILATPFGHGWARGFGQAMGRACRVDPNNPAKDRGYLVVLEDRRLYGDRIGEQVLEWTSETTEVIRRRERDGWDVLRAR
jgi:hypothetical protein